MNFDGKSWLRSKTLARFILKPNISVFLISFVEKNMYVFLIHNEKFKIQGLMNFIFIYMNYWYHNFWVIHIVIQIQSKMLEHCFGSIAVAILNCVSF